MLKWIERLVIGVRKMIDRDTVKRIINVSPEITSIMIEKINLWRKMLDGDAPWCNDYVCSVGIEQGICREFADATLAEMSVSISNPELFKKFNQAIKNLNENLQDGIGLGSFCMKPLGNGQSEFVTADKFIPLSFNGEKPNDIIFFDFRHVDTSKWYIRLERHSIRNGFLKITNIAYASSSKYGFERIVPLNIVPEWKDLPDSVSYPTMKTIDFGYYKNPIKNNIDDTACGVSIFNSAINLIQRADNQEARLEWEFESGERAIHVDPTALKKNKDGRLGVERLNRRLYRSIDIENRDGSGLYEVFSPEFRDVNIINGFEDYLRRIEFNVGLAYGDLSNVQNVEKTATEIKVAKQRKYNRVNAIQNKLRDCLEDFASGLAFHEGMYTSGYTFSCSFKDSILTDENEVRAQDRAEVAMGAMSIVEYRMKWYNETEEEAKRHLPIQNTVME